MRSFTVLLVVSVLFGCVLCESEDGGGDGMWARLRKMVREFVDSLKDLWRQMRDEITARTQDMSSWTKEMFDSFKVKMKEWVDQAKASSTEKEDMRNYIERLQMPKDE